MSNGFVCRTRFDMLLNMQPCLVKEKGMVQLVAGEVGVDCSLPLTALPLMAPNHSLDRGDQSSGQAV